MLRTTAVDHTGEDSEPGPTIPDSGPKSDSHLEKKIDSSNRSATAQFSGSVHPGTCTDIFSPVSSVSSHLENSSLRKRKAITGLS